MSAGTTYEIWVKELNNRRGTYVKEYGKRLPLDLNVYDNESDIGKTVKLLEKLILEE